MIIEIIFQNIIQKIVKHKKSIITTGSVLLLFLLATHIYNSYIIVNISVSTPNNIGKEGIKVSGSNSTNTISLGGEGVKIIPSDITTLTVSANDNIQTQTSLDIPWYHYTHKEITLDYDKNADKIAYTNTFRFACSTYSPQLDSLLSYDCRTPLALSDSKTENMLRKRVMPLPDYIGNSVVPYMGGVIGLTYRAKDFPHGAIAVTSDNGAVSFYALPENITQDKLASSRIFTNTFDTNENRFTLIDDSGNTYLGTPDTNKLSTVMYTKFKPPSDYVKDEQRTLCSMASDDVYCYRGYFRVGDAKMSGKQIRETITKLSFTGNESILKEVSNKRELLEEFGVTSNGQIYGRYYKKLTHFIPNGDSYRPEIIAQNVDSITTGDALYYIQGSGVFIHKDKTRSASHLFYSTHINAKSIYSTKNKTFVLGNVRGAENSTYAYALNNQNNISPGRRIIDMLPTAAGELPQTALQNLVGNNLYLTVAMPMSGPYRNDVYLFNQAKDAINVKLSDMGIDPKELNTVYNY